MLRMGENIYKWSKGQKIYLKNIRAQYKKKNPIKKWVEDLNRYFSKEDI